LQSILKEICDIFNERKLDLLGSILPTFYAQRFYTRRSQEQKIHLWCNCFFALLGSAHVKAVCKYVGEIDPAFFFGPQSLVQILTKKKFATFFSLLHSRHSATSTSSSLFDRINFERHFQIDSIKIMISNFSNNLIIVQKLLNCKKIWRGRTMGPR